MERKAISVMSAKPFADIRKIWHLKILVWTSQPEWTWHTCIIHRTKAEILPRCHPFQWNSVPNHCKTTESMFHYKSMIVCPSAKSIYGTSLSSLSVRANC
jgi:hypothetical protein